MSWLTSSYKKQTADNRPKEKAHEEAANKDAATNDAIIEKQCLLKDGAKPKIRFKP